MPDDVPGAGEVVRLCESWQGRLWTLRPVHVVGRQHRCWRFWMSPGTTCLHPVRTDGSPVPHLLPHDWNLRQVEWRGGGCLYLVPDGAWYMLQAFFDEGTGERPAGIDRWYLNLQTPMSRRGRVFEYLDQELDVVFPADLSSWRWKDAEKMDDLVERGIVTAERAAWLQDHGETVANRVVGRADALLSTWQAWSPPLFPPLTPW